MGTLTSPTAIEAGCRWFVLLLAVVVLVLTGQARAVAHTELVDSNPADGASLAAAPSAVTLTFTEPVSDPAFVVVTAPDGTPVSDGAADISGDKVAQLLDVSAARSQAGSWSIAYRVLSTDGHPVTGELAFAVREAAGQENAEGGRRDEAGGKEHTNEGHAHGAEEAAGSTESHATDQTHGTGWRQYAHWAQLPLTLGALGGLYVWSARRSRNA